MFYEEIFKSLNKRHIDYVVVGGVALVLHGIVRLTADLDLMLSLEEKNIARFVDVMNEFGYKPRIPVKAEELLDPKKRDYWLKEKNMKVFSFYHPHEAISLIDIFIYEPVDYNELKKHSVKMKIGNFFVPVTSIDDLIRLKKISGRKQDIEDIKVLKEIKKYEKKQK
ncbi:hypothetical protein JZK55_00050 [Dissulfurispira thermophila]|uniref:DUF6036 domain-containing protein n=2 Tax=root TaxID=1 RepID=A0A7G1GYV3_9BACT|nr:DUF6036 family nucleotidyltransferase [Dissulfurispira thermophila]BCB95083.1 hypothetical protein JZK55_00050 [Dissulfurispira thermophila]